MQPGQGDVERRALARHVIFHSYHILLISFFTLFMYYKNALHLSLRCALKINISI